MRCGQQRTSVEVLLEKARDLDFLETQRDVCGGAVEVVNERVGRELAAALGAAPGLCGGDQQTADTAAAMRRADVPALEKRHRARVAAFGVGPPAQFDKADNRGCARGIDGDEHRFEGPRRLWRRLDEESGDVRLERVLGSGLGPQGGAKCEPLDGVAGFGVTDVDHWLQRSSCDRSYIGAIGP